MWHTQGSGKSIEMACLGGMLATSTAMQNPTIVLVTDRNNLDHQLYDTFVAAKALLRQDPELAESRSDLREKIGSRPAGGVIFTTIQKFSLEEGEESFPALTDRRTAANMVLPRSSMRKPKVSRPAMRSIFVMRYRMQRSLRLPARQLRLLTETHVKCLVMKSTSTT